MSRRCLICSNLNPCREHSEQAQDAELARNSRAARGLQATTPVAQGDEVRDALHPLMERLKQAEADPLPPGEPLTDEDAVFISIGDLRAVRATLTKGARDAG